MKYLSFTINKYRAIENGLTVLLEKHRLIPVIGINECGKTTILHAIFAFDYCNDSFNKNIHHLDDVKNLYKPGQKNNSKISAKIQIEWDEFKEALDDPEIKIMTGVNSYKRKKINFTEMLVITRDLITKKYDINSDLFTDKDLNHRLSEKIISQLPYILYFDDFRDSIPDEIEIRNENENDPKGWVAIIERLFKKTDESFSVFELSKIEERERKSIISQVKKILNNTLTREWQTFNLDDSDALKISIEYIPESENNGTTKPAKIKFDILETVEGNDCYFYIRDRSKGFFWFFNFVMKLEFNPKIVSNDGVDAIYLLDEPGSYLHAAAQSRLCRKLKNLSTDNNVIYCTHSHYLLDPEIIPISSIRISEKVNNFGIKLISIYEYDSGTGNKNAFQPIYDALQTKPFLLDLGSNENIVLTEGIYDFYCFNMFMNSGYKFLPSQNAESILYFISLMIGWNIKFNALWDNDKEGKEYWNTAKRKFGNDLKDKMLLLPLKGKQRKCILQDFVDGHELKKIKEEIGIPMDSSFDKTIATLFYSDNKNSIIQKLQKTKDNFQKINLLFNF